MRLHAALAIGALAALQQPGPPELPTPESIPPPLRPYLAAAEGLEGLEQSLTLQVAMALGTAAERKALGRAAADSAKHYAANWNAEVGALLAALGPEADDGLAGGALYYDTGVKLDPSTGALVILRLPEARLVVDPGFAERFELRRLIAGLGTPEGLSQEDAKHLEAVLKREVGDLTAAAGVDPWIGHSYGYLMIMQIGAWGEFHAEQTRKGTGFGPFDEFLATVCEHVRGALLDPLRPPLASDATDATEGRNFRFEGDVVLRVHAEDAERWEVPDALAAVNSADHGPILVVETAAVKRWTPKTKHKRVRIGMVAGAEHRTIYDGPWPLR